MFTEEPSDGGAQGSAAHPGAKVLGDDQLRASRPLRRRRVGGVVGGVTMYMHGSG